VSPTVRAKIVATLGLVVLGAAGAALAGGLPVQLTSNGPQPGTVTVGWGSTVTFSNADSEAHAIEIPRLEYTSEPIPPGGSLEYVFSGSRGTYIIRQLGTRIRQGRIVVQVEGTVTLAVKSDEVVYGRRIVFSGSSTVLGWPVAISFRQFGSDTTWTEIASVETAPDGSFTAVVEATEGGRYRASAAADQLRSVLLSVEVLPLVKLATPDRSVPAGQKIGLTASIEPRGAASRAILESYDRARKRWRQVASARVTAAGTALLTWKVEEGRTILRASIPRSGLDSGFASAASRRLVVVGT
jgi:hypothetical protein